MASTTMSTTPSSYRPPPSPFKDPRPPPLRTPRDTAKLWDEYEQRSNKLAKNRETSCEESPLQPLHGQRVSNGTVLDIIKSYDPYTTPRKPSSSSRTASLRVESHVKVPAHHRSQADMANSTTVAMCKTCKQAILSASGVCDQCVITVVLPRYPGESTPPLSPARRNFASTDLPKLHKTTPSSPPASSRSSKRRSQRRPSTELNQAPVRLSSLRPDSVHQATTGPHDRRASLTEPDAPVLHVQINRKPLPRSAGHPTSPTTPPSSASSHHSRHSSSQPRTVRRTSLANVTTPPQFQYSTYNSYSRHTSATPSELSTLYPYISNSTTSPPNVCRASVNLQNTMSAWDNWDSDEDGEKAGLVGYWRAKKWRGSRGSLGLRRDSVSGKEESSKEDSIKTKTKGKDRKRSGVFVRAISCGCAEGE